LCDWVAGHRRWGTRWRDHGTIVRRICYGRRWKRLSIWAIRWCGWPVRSIGGFWIGVCQCLHAGSGPARPPDPAGGGAVHPEAHAQPVGRGAVCALAGEPLLPILLRRAELLLQPAVRPLVADALAPRLGARRSAARSFLALGSLLSVITLPGPEPMRYNKNGARVWGHGATL